jgi:O-antigen/teichoic acid export membrane protein
MVWAAPSRLPFDWRDWLAQVIPLTLGLGASQFIFSVDMLLVRGIYGENQTGFYSASGMIGRGLVMFTTPLSVVMFPKIVHSVAVGKKSNVLLYTLLSTAVLGTLAAAGCTLGAFGLREIIETPGFGGGFLPAALLGKLQRNPDAVLALARLIPWFVWCMLPLAMANVLLNNLLARKNYQAVPYLLLLVAAYVTAAISFADVGPAGKSGASFVRIIQILGVSNLAFLSLCGGFTWRAARKASLQNGAVETIETPVG